MKKYISTIVIGLLFVGGVSSVLAQGNPPKTKLWNTNDFIGGGNTGGTGTTTVNTNGSGTGSTTVNTNNPGSGSTTVNTNNKNNSEAPEKLEDPLGDGISIEGLLLKLFEIILYVGVPIVAFFLIWSGFMFITAQGNPEKLETARSRLLYTIIGAILLLGAWTISQAIKGTVEDIRRGGTAFIEKLDFS